MAARKKRAVVPLPPEENVDPSDNTEHLFPKGTPQGEDGTVATSGNVEVTRARTVGALTADAARQNKISAQVIDRKSKGEVIQWNDGDLITLFDKVRVTFPTTMLIMTNISTGATYKPMPISAFRSVEHLYSYLEQIHRGQMQTTYEGTFKEAVNHQIRAKGKITMPDSVAPAPEAPQSQQPQYPWQIPQPQLNLMQYGMPMGFGALPQQQPPQSIPYASPTPQQTAPASMPQQQQQQPPIIQPIPIPQGMDPATAAMLRGIQEQNQQLQVQIAAILGANQEYKHMLAQHQFAQPQPAPAQVQPQQVPVGVGAPPAVSPVVPPNMRPGMMMLGWDGSGQPVFGYPGGPLAGQPTASAAPTQAAPPPPPPPPPTTAAGASGFVGTIPPRSTDPLEGATAWVSQAMGMAAGLQKLRATLDKAIPGGAQHALEPEDDDETPAPEPAIRSPFGMTKVGDGPDPMVLLTDDKGKIDIGATLTGNITKIPGLLHGLADGLQRINGSIEQIERNRPVVVQGHGVPSPSHSVVGQIPVRMG